MGILTKTKRKGIKLGLIEVVLVTERGGGLNPSNDSYQKLDTTSPKRSILGHNMGANSSYNILCELNGSEDEEKFEDELNGFVSTLKD